MPAWTHRKHLTQSTRNNALAANASHQGYGESALHEYLAMRFKHYAFDKQFCFFCGARGHHTGHFAGYGPIWLCKKRCQNKYIEILRDL